MTSTPNSISIVAISRHGAELARKLAIGLEGHGDLHMSRRFHEPSGPETPFDLPVRPVIQKLFSESQRLVLFMPVGAAVRLLASSLRNKHSDPAVVCVDDGGRFAVSLVSGHLGGADALAQEVAEVLGAVPVITSGSHVMRVLAVDLLGQDLGWKIEAQPGQITRASAAVVNGEAVALAQDAGDLSWRQANQEVPQKLPDNVTIYPSIDAATESNWAAALLITDRDISANLDKHTGDDAVVIYRPKTLVAGMGCRRGVATEHLEQLLISAFDANGLSLASLSCIATAELKKDEPGILELAQKYDVPVRCYSADELNSVFEARSQSEVDGEGVNPPNPPLRKGGNSGTADDLAMTGVDDSGAAGQSGEGTFGPTLQPRVHALLGIWGVAEPSALLAAGSRELLAPRIKTDRATIAIARIA